jgi:formamidopyrimidine-DNA glycosylase
MPELPEVETIKEQLAASVLNRQILDVNSSVPNMVKPNLDWVRGIAVGKTIEGISRRGKYLIFHLHKSGYMVVHLRLNGRLLLRETGFADDPYTYVVIKLDDTIELRLTDSRKFASVAGLAEESSLELMLQNIGPEPLFGLTLQNLEMSLAKSLRPIKNILLDQRIIGGVGNIYANDALWLAEIHPSTPSSRLSDREVEKLHKSLEIVIQEAIDKKGSSKRWFVDLNGNKGGYQDSFKVYSRKGEPCYRHPETLITYYKLGGRGTFICKECQNNHER